MTTILSVDLAAKLSAVIQRGPGGEVLAQFDSRNKKASVFCKELAKLAAESDLTVVEDVPYGIKQQSMIKPVLRLQGGLLLYLDVLGAVEKTIFMSPSEWMKPYPGIMYAPKDLTKAAGDKYRIDQAAHYAREAGYTPPDLVAEYLATLPEGKKPLKKDTNVLEKSMTDYVSAFLMSEFCRTRTKEDLLRLGGVSQATF